ncbi:hypothetical protein HN51_032609, partial [Arachis hypogaea]
AATIVHVHSSVLTSSVTLKADGDAEGSSMLHGTSILSLGQKYKISDKNGEGDDVDAMEDEDVGGF